MIRTETTHTLSHWYCSYNQQIRTASLWLWSQISEHPERCWNLSIRSCFPFILDQIILAFDVKLHNNASHRWKLSPKPNKKTLGYHNSMCPLLCCQAFNSGAGLNLKRPEMYLQMFRRSVKRRLWYRSVRPAVCENKCLNVLPLQMSHKTQKKKKQCSDEDELLQVMCR